MKPAFLFGKKGKPEKGAPKKDMNLPPPKKGVPAKPTKARSK